MKAISTRTSGLAQAVRLEGGHWVHTDEPISLGGSNSAPSPTQLLAGALAACTATTVLLYTDRKRWDLGELAVSVELDTGDPGQPQRLEITLYASPPDPLDADQRERILKVARRCPVRRMMESELAATEQLVVD